MLRDKNDKGAVYFPHMQTQKGHRFHGDKAVYYSQQNSTKKPL